MIPDTFTSDSMATAILSMHESPAVPLNIQAPNSDDPACGRLQKNTPQGFYASDGWPTQTVHLETIPEKPGTFRLMESLAYVDARGRRHVAEKGEETDGRSGSDILDVLLGNRWDSGAPAYVIHDKYCNAADRLWAAGMKEEARALRKQGDDLLPEMLKFLGASRVTQLGFWLGVRARGRWKYRSWLNG